MTPDVTLTIQAGDNFFQPSQLNAEAGQVIEFEVENIGQVTHNARVSGADGEYETSDDFGGQPLTIGAGETKSFLVKIDEAGAFPFRCDFHPTEQVGTLTLQ
jgi:plastocyanin